MNSTSNAVSTPAVPEVRVATSAGVSLQAWLSLAATVALGIVVLTLFWMPLRRTAANLEVNYNEGWNAYKQKMVTDGTPLYGAAPGPVVGATTYPFVSFHVVSWLGRASSYTMAGRWLSLLSVLATGILIALIVRRNGASVVTTVFSFLLYEAGIALLLPSRLGMNDPQLLGEALTTAGLFFYLKSGENRRWLVLSALAFCLGGFTKQNLIAFPAAVLLDLVLRDRKALLLWSGAMAGFGGLLTALTFLVDGRYFFSHLLFPRAYSLQTGWHSNIHEYLTILQGPVLLAMVWAVCTFRRHTVLVLAFVLSHAAAFALAGGDGVDANICFNALAAAVVLSGVALAEIGPALAEARSPLSPVLVPGAVMLALLAGLLVSVPGQWQQNAEQIRALPLLEKEHESVVREVGSHPGPALCESLLVCFEAGKSYEFDPLVVRDQEKIGRLDEAKVLPLLREHYFQSVQIAIAPREAKEDVALLADERMHFSRKFMQELVEDYRVETTTSKMMVWVPNSATSAGASQ